MLKNIVLILVLFIAVPAYAQEGNISGSEQFASTFSCELISSDPAYDGFRQQCLKERYFGLIMPAHVINMGVVFSQNALSEYRAKMLSDNAWALAEAMVAKRNQELNGD